MIPIGLDINEKDYRSLPYPSYSLLSGLSKNGPLSMYGTKLDISDLDSIIIGSIVDSLVTDGKVPDNMVIIDKKPSNKALAIIKSLADRKDLKDPYLLSVKNEKQIKEECDALEYYKTSNIKDRVGYLKKYNKYVKAIVEHGEDAMIVSSYQYNEALALTNALFTKFPFLTESNIIPQVKIIGEVNGIKIKGMLDFIVIDHENKNIIPYDLKTGMGVHNNFFENGFINWGYYIQSSLYKELLTQHIRAYHVEYNDYTIDNFRFMYCGRKDRLPIIYRVTDKWHLAGLQGFKLENKKFTGVYELLEEFDYYQKNPNALYRKGYDNGEIDFEDDLCILIEDGK